MLTGIIILVGLTLGLTAVLIATSRLLASDESSVVTQIERALPRIHCGQCGFPGCAPYAEAIAGGEADINRCPPGGTYTIRRLADLLGREALPLDTSLGNASMTRVARIDESACIGCNLCARACPVDAIVGVHQMMHTVIRDHCTGCELCLPACPVDCIRLVSRNA
jgi:H+/Na+-translocating ferredoxin:NAD+ oxidoreductase subunit B